MKKIILKNFKNQKGIILITCFFMFLSSAVQAGNVGNTSMNITTSARVAGMGYAFTGVANDASAIDFNPAGLYQINQYFFSFMHLSLGPDVFYEYINGAVDTKIGTFGASLSLIHLGEEEGVNQQSFDYSDLLSAIAYSKEIFKGFSGGVTAKFINSTIGEFSARTLLFDVGVLYGFKFLDLSHLKEPNFYLGACLKNIGPGMSYSSETESVSEVTRFGIGYKVGETLTIASDLIKQTGFPLRFGIGVENITGKFINLRLGYRGGENKTSFSGGIGLLIKISTFLTTVDFAYTYENNFNNSSYITFTFQKAPPKADKYSLKPENIFKKKKESKEPKEKEKLILSEEEKKKPVWLKEDHFYAKEKLVYENFEEEGIIPKFTAESGRFEKVISTNKKYGRWDLEFEEKDMILQTSIRLPDLTKFTGIMVSLSSENISKINMVLIEQNGEKIRNWEVVVPGLKSKFQEMKIPFRYFYLEGKPDAKIDLSKISKIKLVIKPEFTESDIKEGWLGIDDVKFYK